MLFTRHKTQLVSADEALPGRETPSPSPRATRCSARRCSRRSPTGIETAVFGLGCFWGAERIFWQAARASTRPPSATPAATRRTRPTRRSAPARTGHTEAVLVVFDPSQISYEELLKVFWEGHDPTQGMRQGNDVGTQYRSAILTTSDAQRAAAERSRDAFPRAEGRRATARSRPRSRRARLLLRRGLPPAVPREEPQRLLRPRRDRRQLPRRRGDRLALTGTPVRPSAGP